MAKGVSIKFSSYEETVPKLLKAIKLDEELKKHGKIIIKPNLGNEDISTSVDFAEALARFCVQHKNPGADVFIAEGADGHDTMDLFEQRGFSSLAEKYGLGIVDLNRAECDEMHDSAFLGAQSVMYPLILKDSFIISISKLNKHPTYEVAGSLSNMLGAYPARHYKGFFSTTKNKLKGPLKYQIHDIIRCGVPQLALMDAKDQGFILAGQPLEVDKQGSKLLGIDWKAVPYIRLVEESLIPKKEESVEALIQS